MAPGRTERAWLTIGQAASKLGCSSRSIRRKLHSAELMEGQIRGVRFVVCGRGRRTPITRIDADCIIPGAPSAEPTGDLDTLSLAGWLGVSPWTIERLRQHGQLIPAEQVCVGSNAPERTPAVWRFTKRAILRFLAEHAVGA